MNSIAFFNNKGGVGKTTLVYHLAWALSRQDKKVLALDLDPQANLSSMCFHEEHLEELKEQDAPNIYQSLEPLLKGTSDLSYPEPLTVNNSFDLVLGDLRLSTLEDGLSRAWGEAFQPDLRAFPLLSAFYRIMQDLGKQRSYDLILVDLGPNLGAINRAALISAEYIINPLAPDLYSLQGLENLEPTIREWGDGWRRVQQNKKFKDLDMDLPPAEIQPLGYIVMQHSASEGKRPAKSYERWIRRIPEAFHRYVLDEQLDEQDAESYTLTKDRYHLASLKHYRSLMAMAQEARKPIFQLSSADGAIGSHQKSVHDCREDFGTWPTKLFSAFRAIS